MNFLIDAHLPKSLCWYFKALGHEAVHTSSLPTGNATADTAISKMATQEGIVVISKDSDFLDTFLLHRMPPKLVMVKIGNMKLADVRDFFNLHAAVIVSLLQNHDLVEVHRDRIVAVA